MLTTLLIGIAIWVFYVSELYIEAVLHDLEKVWDIRKPKEGAE